MRTFLTAIASVLVFVACGGGSSDQNASTPTTAPAPGTTTETGSAQEDLPSSPRSSITSTIPPYIEERLDVIDIDATEVLTEVLRAAAARTGIALEKLRVSEVEQSEFPDASLGCPQPGRVYAQMVSVGNRVVVTGEGQTLEYRVSTSGDFWFCEP